MFLDYHTIPTIANLYINWLIEKSSVNSDKWKLTPIHWKLRQDKINPIVSGNIYNAILKLNEIETIADKEYPTILSGVYNPDAEFMNYHLIPGCIQFDKNGNKKIIAENDIVKPRNSIISALQCIENENQGLTQKELQYSEEDCECEGDCVEDCETEEHNDYTDRMDELYVRLTELLSEDWDTLEQV